MGRLCKINKQKNKTKQKNKRTKEQKKKESVIGRKTTLLPLEFQKNHIQITI